MYVLNMKYKQYSNMQITLNHILIKTQQKLKAKSKGYREANTR